MNQLQKELQEIRPSDHLVMETMRKMHAERAKLADAESEDSDVHIYAASEARVASAAPLRKRMPSRWVAAAASLLVLAGALFFWRASAVPVITLSVDEARPAALAVDKGASGIVKEAVSAEAFGHRAGDTDFTALVPGYSCVAADAAVYFNEQHAPVGDYGVFTYQSGDSRIVLYASTSDRPAPAALLAAEPKRLAGTEVRFGQTADGGIRYAAWTQGGASYFAESEGLGERAFIKLVRRIAG